MDPERPRVFPDADRISSLPDGILSHILSFRPTEESVRTRALSTRWKHLFSLVPILHFDYHYRLSKPSCTDTPSERIARFVDFVDSVFASYNVHNMVRFYFSYHSELLVPSRLSSWISESVRRRVQELEITISGPGPQTLPQSIFTSSTITCLSLSGPPDNCLILDVPEDVRLPCVRKLDLHFVSFIDSDSARWLFRSCPMLEELKLQRTFTGDVYTLDISIPSLKKLTFFGGYEDNFYILLDVPNVENFHYRGGIISHGSFSIKNFKVLSEACIDFRAVSSDGYKALENIVNAVCQVKKLELDSSTFESFQRSGRPLPLFCNLTSLEIDYISCIDSEVLLDLLDKTPHLEVLEVSNWGIHEEDYDESSHHIHFSGERVPACVSLHLKEVRFDNFKMLENEFKMVDYILKNAKILNTFKIDFRGSQEKQLEMSKKLLAFSRWSRDCRIVLNLVTEDLDMEDLDSEDLDTEDDV